MCIDRKVAWHAGRMKSEPLQPGDFLLNRYFPDADRETRDRAREAFGEFARVLEELGEAVAERVADSHESQTCGRIPPIPEVTP